MKQRKQNEQEISQFSRRLPFAFSLIFVAFITTVILEKYYGLNIFYSNFQRSVMNYEVHRIFFSFLRESSILAAAVAWFHLIAFLPKFEVKNGSIIVLFEIFVTNLLIQFVLLSIQALFIYAETVKTTLDSYIVISLGCGISGIFINIYYKYTYFNLQRKRRYYVALLAIILCVVSWQIRVDVIFGFLLSLIQCHCFKGGIMFFSPQSYSQKDNLIFRLKCNKLIRNWIKLNPESIRMNDLCVVQARQFYQNVKQNSIYMQAGQKMKQADIQVQGYQLQPKLGKHEKAQKWQECQIIQNQNEQ